MTLETWVKDYIERRYPSCFDFDGPKSAELGVLVVDMMQWVKGAFPGEFIKTERQLLNYFVGKISKLFDKGANTVIICFDKESPAVKKMVCHTKRYERRCKLCKQCKDLPSGQKAGPEYFHPNCERQCINNQILWHEEGPHLHVDDSHPVDPDWSKFASDSRNLKYELYPRIANALLNWCPKRPGQMLFIDGLPFKQREVREYESVFDTKGFVNQAKMRVILEPWSCEMELPLSPERTEFNKVYCIEHAGHTVDRREIPEMQNDIHEADNAVFFFSRFFPDVRTHMAYINDGDAISIGMLRALEDFRGPENYKHEQWLCLPYKSKKKKALFPAGKAPGLQYINLTKLCQKVEATPEFVEAGVQSPIATLIFLVVLSDTDFFKGEFCFGIGGKTVPHEDEEKRRKQTKGVWDTFFADISMYSHMVQYYPNDKTDLKVERRMVLDEELFELFTQQCYVNKYSAAAAKKVKRSTSSEIDLVRLHCAKSVKDKRKHPPDSTVNQRWARQIAWNLNYWANAFRNIYVDPFERYNDHSYWGYERDYTITNVIAAKQKPLDEVYKRNFWKRRQNPNEMPVEPIADKKKQAALDLIRGKK